MKGPRVHGGPFLLQVFRTTDAGYSRVHAGPAYSPELDAYLHPTATRVASEAKLRLSHDEDEKDRWLTGEEYQSQQRLAAEAREQAARHGRLAAEVRIRELEAELERRGG